MSGGSSANNSWTILTSEETVAETPRPLAEGPQHHGEGLPSAAGPGADPPAEAPPVEGQVVSEEQTAPLSGDTSTELLTRSAVPGSDALSQSEGLPEGPSQSGPDPDSFSDSCAHVGTSPDEPPASLLSAETLEGGEFVQEEERLTEEGAPQLPTGEELQQEGTASGPSQSVSGLGKLADSSVDSEVGEEKAGEGGEPEVRRRSLLAALEQIGRTEEEEDAEEEFQLPRPEEGSSFSLNKCILGAVILLGLGTIFFSGFLMDLDEDSDYGTRELKDSEVPGKREWLNPEVPPVPADADNTEMLNKISVLQAQVQAQKEELKVAKGQAAEGAKQRLRWEEVEKENSRLKTEMASFPVLQKENERMKRELESVPALQKELETLRSTVTELKVSSATSDASVKRTTSPPSGQAEDSRQAHAGAADKHAKKEKDRKKDKYETGEKRKWKEREMSEWREGEKKDRKDVGKSGKHEHGKVDKGKDKEGTEKKQEKERKKDKAARGDEGKTWKAREGKKEWTERSERREEKEWKKTKHDNVGEGKQWRDKEKKDWKRGDDHGERHGGREDWKGENERKKVKGGLKENGREKWQRKEWKEKKEWKSKDGKDWEEGRARGERKQWEQSEAHGKRPGKGRKEKEESQQWDEHEWKGKNAKDDKEWRRKEGSEQWEKKGEWDHDRKRERPQHREESTSGREEHVWGGGERPHTHRRPSPDRPEYWAQQRARLQREPKPQRCGSLEACAQAEGLLPVPLAQFQALLQNYLSAAEEAGAQASAAEQLQGLTGEFFTGGLFAHDQMSFRDFVEDVSDILEHMVEAGGGEEEEDGAVEEELEEFEREALQKFSAGEEEDGVEAGEEGRKERGRGRG